MTQVLEKLPYKEDVETSSVLKQLSFTSRALAELKEIAKSMPNQNVGVVFLNQKEELLFDVWVNSSLVNTTTDVSLIIVMFVHLLKYISNY